ncbi:MAG: glycosyltransferase family 39 protein [Anaerolineae bacterium]|nr:glycosyltransferase family 39 protein [Anaerolineae bacterium]
MRTTVRWVSVAFLGSLLLAALAQWLLTYHRDLVWAGGLGYAMALMLFACGKMREYRRLSHRAARRLFLVACAIGLVVWAAHAAHVRHSYGRAVLLWLAGIALAVVTLLRLERWRLRSGWWREAVAVGGLFVVALALRLVGLARFPDLMLGDEGAMAMEAARVSRGDPVDPFSTGWLAHPTLFFYLEAVALRLFGWNLFGARFTAALLGAFGVPVIYVLAKGMWGRPVAWISAFFLTGWGLSLQLSRLGLNNSADPLFGGLVLAGLHRGLVHNRRWGFVLAGLALGLGMYFYHGTRLLIPLILLVLLLSGARRLRRHWQGLLTFAILALVVAGPLCVDFAMSPGVSLQRQEVIGIGGIFYRQELEQELLITGDPLWLVMVKRLGRSIFPFVLTRDAGYFYTPDGPMLCVVSAVLFVFGVGSTLACWQEARCALLLAWLGLTILFGGFLLDRPPQYQRYLIAAPAICMLVGRGGVILARLFARLWDWRLTGYHGIVLCIAVVLLVVDVAYYFGAYVPSGAFGDRDSEIADRAARLMTALGPDYVTYFFGAAHMSLGGFSSVRFLAPDADWVDVVESPPSDWRFVQEGRGALFILLQERSEETWLLRERFPGGEERQVIGRDGEALFTFYRVDSVAAQPSTGKESR